jgi:hypothetical protein
VEIVDTEEVAHVFSLGKGLQLPLRP